MITGGGCRARNEPGVRFRLFRLAWQVEAHETVIRKKTPHQARLSRLPGTRQHHHRARRGTPPEQFFHLPVNPHLVKLYNSIEEFAHHNR